MLKNKKIRDCNHLKGFLKSFLSTLKKNKGCILNVMNFSKRIK